MQSKYLKHYDPFLILQLKNFRLKFEHVRIGKFTISVHQQNHNKLLSALKFTN